MSPPTRAPLLGFAWVLACHLRLGVAATWSFRLPLVSERVRRVWPFLLCAPIPGPLSTDIRKSNRCMSACAEETAFWKMGVGRSELNALYLLEHLRVLVVWVESAEAGAKTGAAARRHSFGGTRCIEPLWLTRACMSPHMSDLGRTAIVACVRCRSCVLRLALRVPGNSHSRGRLHPCHEGHRGLDAQHSSPCEFK